MKKILHILLFLATYCSAQQYRPMLDSTSTWCYTGNIMPVNIPDTFYSGNCFFPISPFMQSAKIFSTVDTVINSNEYTITELADYFYNQYCRYGYLREDTLSRKVYYLNDQIQNEVLLYDFSMQPGDTISLYFSFANGFYESGVYVLDSIKSFLLDTDSSRAFFLNCTTCSGPSNTLEWIEGIGHRGELAYPFTNNMLSWGGLFWSCNTISFPYNYTQILARFQNSQTLYNDSCALQTVINNPCFAFMDSCSYWVICGNVNEYTGYNINISPNPASDYIDILNKEENAITKIDINNMAGILLKEEALFAGKRAEYRITLDGLDPGIYIIRIYGEYFTAGRKLVIK